MPLDEGQEIMDVSLSQAPDYRFQLNESLERHFHKAISAVENRSGWGAGKRADLSKIKEKIQACKRALVTPHRIYSHYVEFRHGKACCPFHEEKTPSMQVYNDGHYHCYGCHAHGDIFDFVMRRENLSFTAAVERVCAHLGVV